MDGVHTPSQLNVVSNAVARHRGPRVGRTRRTCRRRPSRLPISPQQAALATDVRDLVEAAGLDHPILVGFDWGNRAAGAAAYLWPEMAGGLVAIGGYALYDPPLGIEPAPPDVERRFWYAHYFCTDRGRRALEGADRDLFALLWREWPPNSDRSSKQLNMMVESATSPDFAAVVTHAYRHRMAGAAGDTRLELLERRLAGLPTISVQTVVVEGTANALDPPMPP